MISAELFLAILQEKDLLPAEVIERLRKQIGRMKQPPTGASLAQQLIAEGHLTPALAKRLMEQASFTPLPRDRLTAAGEAADAAPGRRLMRLRRGGLFEGRGSGRVPGDSARPCPERRGEKRGRRVGSCAAGRRVFGRSGRRRQSQTAACCAAADAARSIARSAHLISFAFRTGASSAGRRGKAAGRAGTIVRRSLGRLSYQRELLEFLAAEEVRLAEGAEKRRAPRLPAEQSRPRPQGQRQAVHDDGARLGDRRAAGHRRPDLCCVPSAGESRRDVAEGPGGLSGRRLRRGRRAVRLVCDAFFPGLRGPAKREWSWLFRGYAGRRRRTDRPRL